MGNYLLGIEVSANAGNGAAFWRKKSRTNQIWFHSTPAWLGLKVPLEIPRPKTCQRRVPRADRTGGFECPQRLHTCSGQPHNSLGRDNTSNPIKLVKVGVGPQISFINRARMQ